MTRWKEGTYGIVPDTSPKPVKPEPPNGPEKPPEPPKGSEKAKKD